LVQNEVTHSWAAVQAAPVGFLAKQDPPEQ
jgi:hypothetical protein